MNNQANLFSNVTNTTPMMKQYMDIKSENSENILFYRMGDFYEMFFEDAILASSILSITLTKRGQHNGEDIPMCGVPFHSADSYIEKLIERGYKVAICEQMESPEEAKKRGYKAVVKREVVRIITPGTLTEENLLNKSSANFLLAISGIKEQISLAWVDISTGQFYTSKTIAQCLNSDIFRIMPAEILVSDRLYSEELIHHSLLDFKRIITIQSNNLFDLKRAEHKIRQYFNIFTIDSLGQYSNSELIACGVILEYLELTQKNVKLKISIPKQITNSLFLSIDSATRRNLELTSSILGEKDNTLLSVMDKTKTNAGFRLLNQYLSAPLVDIESINNRLNLVEFFLDNNSLREELESSLPSIGDIERSITRLYLNRGGPRDLQVIQASLNATNEICAIFSNYNVDIPLNLQNHLSNFENFERLRYELDNSLSLELPNLARDGGFIKDNYNTKLDELKIFKSTSSERLQILKQKYIALTGINSLKINYNNVLGYFIDITPQNASKMKDDIFIHRQTLANSVRYTSLELRELESEILNVSSNILNLELELYDFLVSQILNKSDQLLLLANSIAAIDVAQGLAFLAKKYNYTRPIISNSDEFIINDGKHPVIEKCLLEKKQDFIANNCTLQSGSNLWLITGPNMAGKSTFLRQNAIITIMAQMGSFVPAKYAKIGIVDKIFSRVGAADDLARGRSTFMVEMVETANILNNATNKSLIILDEIGRGTSTYDGVSIASACLEYIHNKLKCRALFATHYHELTTLQSQLLNIACYTMQIKEWQNKVIFLYIIISGIADKSYGIHVASMAGLPQEVINRADQILSNLENDHNKSILLEVSNERSLTPAEKFINELDLDDLSAKQALEILYSLKKML